MSKFFELKVRKNIATSALICVSHALKSVKSTHEEFVALIAAVGVGLLGIHMREERISCISRLLG